MFLQAVPESIDMQALEQQLLQLEDVDSIHHTHAWSLDGDEHVFSTHLVLKTMPVFIQLAALKSMVTGMIKAAGFSCSTVEMEYPDESCEHTCH